MILKRRNAASLSMPEAEKEMAKDPSIRLIDVRSREEYREGHIPNSINIPLDRLADISSQIPDKQSKLFVYCLSGGRSQMACGHLQKLGYENVTNIGGITQWKGKVVKSQS